MRSCPPGEALTRPPPDPLQSGSSSRKRDFAGKLQTFYVGCLRQKKSGPYTWVTVYILYSTYGVRLGLTLNEPKRQSYKQQQHFPCDVAQYRGDPPRHYSLLSRHALYSLRSNCNTRHRKTRESQRNTQIWKPVSCENSGSGTPPAPGPCEDSNLGHTLGLSGHTPYG